MALEIKTAAEVIVLDVEGRGAARRAARETELLRCVLRAFVDRAGPVQVEEIVSALPAQAPEKVRAALVGLDREDLIRLDAGRVDLAYPFSASRTPFVLDLGPGGGERYVCCAVDALGIAPMLGRSVRIRSRCHHCAEPIELSVGPAGPGPGGEGVMVWVGKRAEDEGRACDAL
jgi:alkylmercury lyase-like protein